MPFVKFPTSGTFSLLDDTKGSRVSPCNLFVYNEELGMSLVSSGIAGSGTANFNIPDAHTSKDSYVVVPSAFGHYGHARDYKGFSPTTTVLYETFQVPPGIIATSTGTIVESRGFEDISLSGFAVTVTGGVAASGIINASTMQGDYHVRLTSNGASVGALLLQPTAPAASGLLAGRAIMLTRNATSTTALLTDTGIAFFRESNSTIASNAYKFSLVPTDADSYLLSFSVGQMSNAGNMHVGTEIFSQDIDFTSKAARDARRNIWMMVEWEYKVTGLLYNFYYRFYQQGDTIQTVKEQSTLLRQGIFVGSQNGANIITTPLGSPTWFICSEINNAANTTGMDMLHLEGIDKLPEVGLNSFELIQTNSGTGPRVDFSNSRSSVAATPRFEGVPLFAVPPINPFVKPVDSWINIYGYNFIGPRSVRVGSGNSAFGFFTFKAPTAPGITHGTFRYAVRASNNLFVLAQMAFCFLRQGAGYNDNAYTIEPIRVNSTQCRINIRKGVPTTGGLSDSLLINGGAVVAFTGLLSWNENLNSITNIGWIEVRWQAKASSVDIEVLFCSASQRPNNIDVSPGNLDYKLVSVLTYTDASSPYLSTSQSPMLILNGPVTAYACELRRLK